MNDREKRERELFRLPLEILLALYKKARGIPDGTQAPTGILVSEMISAILDAEFPTS